MIYEFAPSRLLPLSAAWKAGNTPWVGAVRFADDEPLAPERYRETSTGILDVAEYAGVCRTTRATGRDAAPDWCTGRKACTSTTPSTHRRVDERPSLTVISG